MSGINQINNKILPATSGTVKKPGETRVKPDASFKELLDTANSSLKVSVSKHAQVRMQSRNIMLDKGQVERLNLAVERARQKGIRDTLVLMDDKAFVVNVKNTTIITAANREALKDRVFTNIDGAVIV